MYTLTYEGQVLYDPRSPTLYIRDPSVHLAVDEAGSLSFTINVDHPYISYLQVLQGRLELKADDDVIYRGRILSDTQDFSLARNIVSEGQLACLNDSVVEPFEFPGDYEDDEDYQNAENVVEYWLGKLLDAHNAQVDEEQQILLGTVTVTDSNNYIARSSEDYMSTWECLTSKFRDSSLGGHFLARYEDDGTYLDYVSDYPLLNTQSIEFAKNILDLRDEIDGSEVYTIIMPIGADGLTIEGLDDGSVTSDIVKEGALLYSKAGIEKYGRITSVQTWNDVTVASNLRTKAAALLADSGVYMNRTITVTAVDLHCTDDDIAALRVGRYTPVYSEPHGLDVSYAITELDPDIQDPGNTRITLGATVQTMTTHTARAVAQLEEKITSIYLNLGTISSKTIIEVDVEYYSSDSSSELTGGEWSTDAPDWDEDKYIWTRTKTVTADGTTSYSDAVCISGASGEDGLGITDITEQYYLSSSSEECTGGEWSEECPDWSDGYYIWTRSNITWSDGSETDTTPVLATALNDLYTLTSSLTQYYSSLEQTTSEITAIVGSWTETIGTSDDGTVITIAEAVSTLQQTAESITLTIENNTWLTEDDAAVLYATKSELTATADEILVSVSSSIEDAVSSITVDAESIRMMTTTLTWSSENSSMDADGTLTCTNAVMYGTVTSENGDWTVSMTSGMLQFYYDGSYYGGVSATCWWEDNSYRGIRMMVGESGYYIAFEYGDPDSEETVDPSYLINYGLNPDDITQRHIFYDTAYFDGAVTATSYIYAESAIRVSNNIYIQWYNTSGDAASLIRLSDVDAFVVGSFDYPTYIYGSTLYLGSTSYPTYLYGSSIRVSGAITFASAVTCSSTLSVTSTTTLSGAVSCGSTLTVTSTATFSGAVKCNSTLAVTSTTTLSGAVSCGSTLTVTSTATFSSAVKCNSTLAVSSTATFSGAVKCNSTLAVSSTATFSGAVKCNSTLAVTSTATFSDIEVSSTATFSEIGVSSAAAFSGTATFGSTATFSGAVTFNSTTTFGSTATFNSYLRVSTSYGIYFGSTSSSVKLYKASSYSILHVGTSFCIPNGSYYYALTSSGGYLALIQLTSDNAVYVGSSSYVTYVRGSTLYLNGSQYSSSDLRLKCDVEPLGAEYLEVLDGLAPMRYRFKGASQLRAGFVAQDVMETLDELGLDNVLVSQDEDGMYYLDYNAIIPLLVAGYQTLKRKIARLEASA